MKDFNDTQDLFGEVFSEWQTSNTDYNSPEQVLDEAYYSINCDYYLSAYLQYPLTAPSLTAIFSVLILICGDRATALLWIKTVCICANIVD